MPSPKFFPLNTGAVVPSIGLGTWRSPVGEVEAAVYHAIVHAGYRHIDCAFAYGNEAEVGSALKRIFAEGHVTRSDLFITSKLWSTYHTRAAEGIQKSLDLLGLDYLDLYLIHWPIPLNAHGNSDLFPTLPDGSRDIDTNWTFNQTWASLEDLHKAGKARAIGVSNFSVPYLQRLLEGAKVVPAVNQIENHPLLLQTKLVEFCQSKGIVVTAYSPFGSIGGPLLANPVLKGIAEKNGVSVGNVILNSLLSRGIVVIPKSVTPKRIEENNKLVDLDEKDLATIAGLHKTEGIVRFVKPGWPVNLLFDEANWGENLRSLL